MRGKKAKELRRAPGVLSPNRVVARIQIVALADGQVGIKNLPDDERFAREIMVRAAKRMAAHFEAKAKRILTETKNEKNA